MSTTPEYFVEVAGVDMATAQVLASQHTAMSSPSQVRVELAEQLTAPPTTTAPADRTAYFVGLGVSPSDAARLAAEEAGMSGLYKSPEQIQTERWQQGKQDGVRLIDETAAMEQQKFDELHEQAMAPAKNAWDYQLPRSVSMSVDEQVTDSAIREAMLAGGIPVFAGNAIAEDVAKIAAASARLSPDAIAMNLQTVASQLRGMWGEDYTANVAHVSDYVDRIADKHPVVAQILDNAPHLIGGSALVMDQLLQVAKHQARRP